MKWLWLFLNRHLQLFDYAVLLTGRSLFWKGIYRLSDYSTDLRSTFAIVSHSSRCKVVRAHMRGRGLRVAAYECGSLQTATLSLKVKFLHLFLWAWYLNWRGYNVVGVLHRQGMRSCVYKFIPNRSILLWPMRAVPHVVNSEIAGYIVNIIHSYVCLLFAWCTIPSP